MDERISAVLLDLHTMDLCVTMASNGDLSAEDYNRTMAFLDMLNSKTTEQCQQLTEMVQGIESAALFIEAVDELRDAPRRLRLLRSLRFTADETTSLLPGDTFPV